MASKDFIVKNGLRIGGSSATGALTAGNGRFTTSLSAAALSGAAGAGLTTGATIALGGDVTGSVALDTLNGTKTISTTIAANSVALGTDTTGNYVQSVALNTDTQTLTASNLAAAEGNTITGLGLSATGVTAAAYGSSTAIPVITVLEDGRIKSVSTSSISTDLTIAADSGSNDTVTLGTDTLTFAGTSNEIETTVSNNQIQIGLPNDITIAGNLTVNGTCTLLNQAVTATTTATENNFVIRSTDTGADASPDLKLWRDSSDPDDNDYIGNIFFTGTNSAAEATDYAHIVGQITDVTNGTEDARLSFKTMAAGTLADRLTINSGLVGIGTTNPNEELTVSGTLSASTSVCSPIIAGATCVDSALICGTAASFGGGYSSTGVTIASDGDICTSGKFSIGTVNQNANLTVAGTISASGVVYGDAFESTTGGSAISFNDNITLTGTLSATDNIVHVGDPDTLLSFGTDTFTVCAAGSNLFRVDGANNVVGVGTVTTASPSVPTVVEFNNNTTAYRSASATINDSASAALLCFPHADYRTGKVVVQAVGIGGSSSHIESSELLITHDGTTAHSTEYGTIRTGNDVGTYTSIIVGSNLELRVTNGLGAQACFVASIQHLMA